MATIALKIKVREILIANPEMLASLDVEFGELLNNNPYFNYNEDEFLYWLVDIFLETENGQANFHWN